MAGDNILAATIVAPKVLYSAQLTTFTTTKVVDVAAGTSVKITSAVVVNSTVSAATLTLGICKTGDTAGVSHNVYNATSIAANTIVDLSAYLKGVVLGPGDFVNAGSGTGTALTLILTGMLHS
jgi:hypothetical protein